MNTEQGLKILKKEGIFWSRLGFNIDPPSFDCEGNCILNEPAEVYFKYHRDMADAGIKVHTCIVPSGWKDSGEYNFKTTMEVIDRLMKENPEIYFMPRIKLNPPVLWQKKNPKEIFVFENGPETEEEIAELIGTEKHNTVGDGRVGPLISNQSISSLKWQEDAKEYLNVLIDLIESRDYSDRIIGYHIGYALCGETHMWGNVRTLDFGINEKKRFFEFGMEKYGSKEVLKKKWGTEVIDENHVPIPKETDRFPENNTPEEFFHIGDKYTSYMDYNLYRRKTAFEAIENFAELVKKKTDKFVGFFHGYVMTGGADRHGHTDLEEVLNSDYIDFICAPKSYYRNSLGEPGGYYAPPLSVNMKKLWIDEMDYPNNTGNNDDFIKVLWREFAKDMSMQTPFWWMDLLGGWYNHEEVRRNVKELIDIKKNMPEKRESIAEILLVLDENSAMYTPADATFQCKTVQEAQAQAAISGMPYDIYRKSDLKNIDLERYKIIYFLNCFEFSEEDRKEFYKRIKKDTTVIFNYTFGIISGGFSVDNIEKNTGFKLKEVNRKTFVPYFEIEKSDAVRQICSFGDIIKSENENQYCSLKDIPNIEATAVAELTRDDGGRSIMAAIPALNSKLIRKIAEEAGCGIYAPYNTVVYGDSRFISIFAHEDIDESAELNGEYYDVIQKAHISGKINLKLKKGEFVFLIKNI